MAQAIPHRLERDVRKGFGPRGQLERLELGGQLSIAAAHSASLLRAAGRITTNPPPPTSILAAWAAHTERPACAQSRDLAWCRPPAAAQVPFQPPPHCVWPPVAGGA